MFQVNLLTQSTHRETRKQSNKCSVNSDKRSLAYIKLIECRLHFPLSALLHFLLLHFQILLLHRQIIPYRRLKKRMSAVRAASQGFSSSGKTPLALMELPLLCLRVWKDSKWIDRPCFSTWSKLEAIRLRKGDLCFQTVWLCSVYSRFF